MVGHLAIGAFGTASAEPIVTTKTIRFTASPCWNLVRRFACQIWQRNIRPADEEAQKK
jgi:hypothetical protein